VDLVVTVLLRPL